MKLLAGYAVPVVALASNRDGSRLYSAARGHATLWEWDTATGDVVAKRKPPDGSDKPVLACAVTAGGEVVCARRNIGDVPALAVHPSREVVALTLSLGATHYGVQLNDLGRGETRQFLVATTAMVSLSFTPDGSRLAVASAGGEVILCDILTGDLLGGYRPKRRPTQLSFNAATGRLAVACNLRLEVVECETWKVVAEYRWTNAIRVVAHSPDGRFLAAAGDDGVVVVYDGSTHAVAGRRHLDIGEISCLCWSGDSAKLFAGGNKVIAVCDLSDLVGVDKPRPRSLEPLTLEGFRSNITSLVYAGDGRSLFGMDAGERVCAWDLSNGAGQAELLFSKLVYERHGKPMRSEIPRQIAPSEDGSTFVLTSYDCATFHDGRTGERRCDFSQTPNIWHRATSLPGVGVFVRWAGPDGRRLSLHDERGEEFDVWSDPAFRLFDPAATAALGGRGVLFTGPSGGVYTWDRDAKTVEHLFSSDRPLVSLALSPDGSHLAVASRDFVDLRDFPTLGPPTRLRHPLACTGAAFAPDGRLVTSCHDGGVRVWDAGGRVAFGLDLGMGRVHTIAVSPDGMTFAAGVHKRNAVVLMDVPE